MKWRAHMGGNQKKTRKNKKKKKMVVATVQVDVVHKKQYRSHTCQDYWLRNSKDKIPVRHTQSRKLLFGNGKFNAVNTFEEDWERIESMPTNIWTRKKNMNLHSISVNNNVRYTIFFQWKMIYWYQRKNSSSRIMLRFACFNLQMTKKQKIIKQIKEGRKGFN